MNSWIYRLCLVTQIALLSACIPHSQHPITPAHEHPVDTSLLGSWYWRQENETGFVHVGLDFRSKLLRVVMVDLDRSSELELSEFLGHTSTLGENLYLNLRWLRTKNEVDGYLFVKYRPEGESLAISLADTQVLEEAVKKGLLQGVVPDGGGHARAVRITESGEGLRRFLIENDGRLFPKAQWILRLPLPQEN